MDQVSPEFIFDAYAFFSRSESLMYRDVKKFMHNYFPETYELLCNKDMAKNCRMLIYNMNTIHLKYFVMSQFFLWNGIMDPKFSRR